jgi:hypothetical protein
MATKVIAGTFEGIRTLQDRSVKLTFTTQELNPSDVGDLFSFQNKFCKIMITDANVVQANVMKEVELAEVESWEKSKSPAQRLRGVLFLLYSKDSAGHPDFDSYYKSKVNGIIEHFKSKIDA